MNRETVLARIREIGIIPAIRLYSAAEALFAADALADSGIPIAEVTMTVPGTVEVIRELTSNAPDFVVGAGSIFDLDVARRCIDAGAQFLTSPGLDLQLVELARKEEVVVFPGALTPTEITAAWKAGADFVKVFPCAQLGGPAYLKALRSPFHDVPLIASGGVNQQTARDFILAGAAALGIGRDLIQPDAIERREYGWIRELSHRFLRIVHEARAQLAGA